MFERMPYVSTAIGFLFGGFISFMLWNRKSYKTEPSHSEVIFVNENSVPCNSVLKNESNSPQNSPKCSCDNKFCYYKNVHRLIQHIDDTKYTIDLAMCIFTAQKLCEAFVRAIHRGVTVRIIVDSEMCHASSSQINKLLDHGASIRTPKSNTIMHHKFGIFDGPQRSAFVLRLSKNEYDHATIRSIGLTGSMNWTMQGLVSNFENVLIFTKKKPIEMFEYEFDRMWNAFGEIDKKAKKEINPKEIQ